MMLLIDVSCTCSHVVFIISIASLMMISEVDGFTCLHYCIECVDIDSILHTGVNTYRCVVK